MPISRGQFDRGLSFQQLQILRFLEGHRDRAFSLLEIGEGIHLTTPEDAAQVADLQTEILRHIEHLVRKELVKIAKVGKEYYYAIPVEEPETKPEAKPPSSGRASRQ